jgi:hypothetical protein
MGTNLARIGNQVTFLDDRQVLKRYGRAHGMPAGGEAVPEGADAVAFLGNGPKKRSFMTIAEKGT